MTSSRTRCLVAAVTVAAVTVVALTGCGSSGGGGATEPSSSAAVLPPASVASITPTTDSAPTVVDSVSTVPPEVASSGVEPGPICDSVPSLEVISGIVGEPLTAIEDNSQPSVMIEGKLIIEQRCDASGASAGAAVFERSDIASGPALLDEAASQGLVVDKTWPELPGAVAWANGVTIELDGLWYSAVAFTLDTIGQADAPAAYDASAALLIAWIGG